MRPNDCSKTHIPLNCILDLPSFNPLSANPTKLSNTLKFVGLAIKGLKRNE